MTFTKGDIIEYCNELFEVENVNYNSGTVYQVNDKHERSGLMIKNFYWSAYGEDCTLIKRP